MATTTGSNERLTVRDTPRAVALTLLGTIGALLALVVLFDRPYSNGQPLLGIGLGIGGAACLVAARQAVLVATDGITLRYPLTSRFISWDHVLCFQVRDMRNAFGERLARPAVLLRTGDAFRLP